MGEGEARTREVNEELTSILRPRFSSDQRGLMSEMVRRLMERRRWSAVDLSAVLGERLGRTGPMPELVDAWGAGEGSPPPGDALTELMKLAREDPELAPLVDALIGPSPETATDPGAGRGRRQPWRVFLSHTSDLREYPASRSYVEAAEAAIVRAGHAVADMAYFVARDLDPAAHCVATLAETDLYVGVIGFRLGALVPGRAQSFTELEFDTATALGLPRLVFMLRDEVAADLPDAEQPPESDRQQQSFRRRLQDTGVTTVWIRSPHELELSVLHALVELAASARAEAGASRRSILHGSQPERRLFHGVEVPEATQLVAMAAMASLASPLHGRFEADQPANHQYVDGIWRTIHQLVNIEVSLGSNELAPLAVRHLRTARRRLDLGQYEPSVERELQAALSELAELAAWLLHDAGRQDASRRVAYEALHLSRLAGSPQQMDLFILGNLAHVEIFTGQAGAALQIARTALDTGSLGSRLTAMFRIREARALAQLGDRAGAERALASAHSNLLDGVSDSDPPWSWWLDEPEFIHHSGQVFASLGVHNRALALLERANEECPPTRISGRFIYLAHSLTEAVEANAWSDVGFILKQTMPYAQEVGSGRAADVLLQAVKRQEQLPATPTIRDASRRLRAILVASSRPTHPMEEG